MRKIFFSTLGIIPLLAGSIIFFSQPTKALSPVSPYQGSPLSVTSLKQVVSLIYTSSTLPQQNESIIYKNEKIMNVSTVQQEVDFSGRDLMFFTDTAWRKKPLSTFYVQVVRDAPGEKDLFATKKIYTIYGPFKGNIRNLINKAKQYRSNDHLTGSKYSTTSGDIVLTNNPLITTR